MEFGETYPKGIFGIINDIYVDFARLDENQNHLTETRQFQRHLLLIAMTVTKKLNYVTYKVNQISKVCANLTTWYGAIYQSRITKRRWPSANLNLYSNIMA